MKNITGARVHYCGHDASFIADVHIWDSVAVIVGPEDVEQHLNRPAGKCDIHISDFPEVIYWGRKRGVFVVPLSQVMELANQRRDNKIGRQARISAGMKPMRYMKD